MTQRFLLLSLVFLFSFSAQAEDYVCHFPASWPVDYVVSPAAVGGSVSRIERGVSSKENPVQKDHDLLPGEPAFDYTIKNFLSKKRAGVPDHLWPQVTRIRQLDFGVTTYTSLFLIYVGDVQIGGMYSDVFAKVQCLPDSVVLFPDALSVAVSPAKPQINDKDQIVDGVTMIAPWFTATYEYKNNSAADLTIASEFYAVWTSTSHFQTVRKNLNPPIVLKPGETKISKTSLGRIRDIQPGSSASVDLEIEGPAKKDGFRPVYGRFEHGIQ